MQATGDPARSAGTLRALERAIRDDRITGLAEALARVRGSAGFGADEWFPAPLAGRHARKLVFADPAGRFVVVAMTWAPGCGTPLHDHGGTWGAEIVIDGELDETTYALRGRASGRWQFEPTGACAVRPGDVRVLLPPLEYHTVVNTGAAVARTVHVYAGTMPRCTVYAPSERGWWAGEERVLSYDA